MKQMKSSIRKKMYGQLMRVRTEGRSGTTARPPPPVRRPLRAGLPYKYKITREREGGNWKPYPSEILHDVFRLALILLPKRSK